jgi:hypothetical protein
MYAISMTVAHTFKEQTSCDAGDIMKASLAGFSRGCEIHVEIIDEGSIH